MEFWNEILFPSRQVIVYTFVHFNQLAWIWLTVAETCRDDDRLLFLKVLLILLDSTTECQMLESVTVPYKLMSVCYSALEYCLNVENINLSAIRTIRVLRPLRAINRIPSKLLFVPRILWLTVRCSVHFLKRKKRSPCIISRTATR